MNVSAPFILRPVGTTLLAAGLFLIGAVAYFFLPVASLPSVDFPTIRVAASRPGADPGTMAASVAAPLERRLGEIAGLTEMTSSSALGSTSISLQFDLNRNIDAAARDVQAALNAAATDLPGDLPTLPVFKKANPAAAPIIIFALTSDTMRPAAVYDVADTVIAQRMSQVQGVAEVNVAGAEQPALRVRIDAARLQAMNVGLDAVQAVIAAANAQTPLGAFEGASQSETIAASDQLLDPRDYGRLVIHAANGAVVRLSDVATIEQGVRNTRSAGWYNTKPAVLLIITKQADANVIDTVDRLKALLPELHDLIPAGVEISVLTDRTATIRASVADIQRTLVTTIALVMMVVFIFLRRATPTIAAGITVPLSLAGAFAAMWAAHFSLDNLSLMAITIAVGFVVDDAIVMIEVIQKNLDRGMPRIEAALLGARQIGFTVISISLSLLAAFTPLFFLGGIPGRLLREFSLTLAFAIIISTIVSLTVTPMICGRFMKRDDKPPSRLDRMVDGSLAAVISFYARTLTPLLDRPWLALPMLLATIALTVELFIISPKGLFPNDDSGLIFSFTEASADISFPAMSRLQQQAARIVNEDPAVLNTASFIGSGGPGGGAVNQGRLFISLKPESERGPVAKVIARIRRSLAGLAGIRVFMISQQDVRAGGRVGKAAYQFTLWDSALDELSDWTPKVLARLRALPGLVDVSTDREQGGLQANIIIDREAAARLGVKIQDIDNALNDAFGQRQISTIYTQRNQYRVVVEVAPSRARDPNDLTDIFLPGGGGKPVPLRSFARIERDTQALVVNHQGLYPSTTITYNLGPDANVDLMNKTVAQAVAELHPPDGLHADFAGDAKVVSESSGGQGILILVALLAVYIILGVLYESLIHPVTIISTLPSAGLGALLALLVCGTEITLIAFIGIILLIGIVKKNGIMLVDFAIQAERARGLSHREAIFEACIERFRPILMTTLAALLGAVPLAIATGAGADLRRPLGITIVGGLVLSQALTLYTTPAIYLLMSKLQRRRRTRLALVPSAAE